MDSRTISDEYAKIGAELIKKEPSLQWIAESDITIVYLSSTAELKKGGKLILGQCEKIPDKYKWAIPADFTITLFEPNITGISKEQLKILILHELLHVGNGEIIPHDVEDFRMIIDRYGLDWASKNEPNIIDAEQLHRFKIKGI